LSVNGCDVWQREIGGVTRVGGSSFTPGWTDGIYQPQSYRFGSFISLCALGFLVSAFAFKRKSLF
jgi:hypothetical protein